MLGFVRALSIALIALVTSNCLPTSSFSDASFSRNISSGLFHELEEMSRLVGISYCVGSTGIHKPFECLSHCSDFNGFELVTTWNTGILDPDSCGYIALSHPPWPKRIIVVFRGTNSISDAVHDLMTARAEYLPYPLDDATCDECAVHAGFMMSWKATRSIILPILQETVEKHPEYELTLAGHSLGGAVAGLAALELKARGWKPKVTTFGEPRLGNKALAQYFEKVFPWNVSEGSSMYRRVTHVRDPVPLLPFETWGWHMHSGEVFISKSGLQPEIQDLERCEGDEDLRCIQNPGNTAVGSVPDHKKSKLLVQSEEQINEVVSGIPGQWKAWELLFAHREYFWRLGLCWDPQWRSYSRADDDTYEL